MSEQYARGRNRVGGARLGGATSREIASSAEAAIAAGELAPGSALPSVRRLAADLGVSPTTVSGAYGELRRRGLVVSQSRSGVRVAERPPLAAPAGSPVPEGVRDLAGGNPDRALLPDLGPVLRRLGGRSRLYGEEAVLPELEGATRAWLGRDGIDASHLCVTGGALDGVERVLGAHVAGGDAVAVEDPGFAGVLDLVRAMGLEPAPVPVDEAGMRPNALAAALRAGARAIVVTPRGQNPTGAALDARRARELARVLDRFPAALLVEDDHLGPVAGVPARTLSSGRSRWATIRSVSKWLGPDLRVAVVAGDPVTVARVQGRQAVGTGWVSTLLQQVVAALLTDPDMEGLAGQAATVYAGRRAALVDALAAHGIAARAASGLNVWVPVPDEDAAVRALLASGWAVGAGTRHRISAPPGIRITAAALKPGEAKEVAAAVAGALAPGRRTRAA